MPLDATAHAKTVSNKEAPPMRSIVERGTLFYRPQGTTFDTFYVRVREWGTLTVDVLAWERTTNGTWVSFINVQYGIKFNRNITNIG
jgi:hypothetical protein